MSQTNEDHLSIIEEPTTREPFVPEAADYFSNPENHINTEISDTGDTVTVTAEDLDGNEVILEYGLSQVIIEEATYSIPGGDVGPTTPPKTVSRNAVFPETENDAELILDGEPVSFPEAAAELWERSLHHTPESDYYDLHGLDDADNPNANEYSCYFVLKKGYFVDTPHSPFFIHDSLERQ